MTGRLEKETAFYAKLDEKLKGAPPVMREFCNWMRANRMSYNTIKDYTNKVLHFIRFVNLGDDFYKKVTIEDVEAYMISLQTRQTSSGLQRTGDDILQGRWSALNTFFNWLLNKNYIIENPIIKVNRPKNETEHKVVYLNKQEIGKLIKATENNRSQILALRDKTLISLALATGLRISALTNIDIQDIDFENSVIKVIEKRQKIREIPIGENTLNLLKEWIKERNNFFVGVDSDALFLSTHKNRMSYDAAENCLTRCCKIAGIKRITPHKLRTSSACALAEKNIPVKAIAQRLGHTRIETTMRYIDVFNEDAQRATGVLDNLF